MDSSQFYKLIEEKFNTLGLHRPMQISRYEAGTELEYEISAVENNNVGKVKLQILRFVGGGFAGQVYQVRIISIDGNICGLKEGEIYAVKILVPPSGFSLLFRNLLYRIGFQGDFQLQVNPAAARAGAILQKFIRKAATAKFGDSNCINDVHGTFVDSNIGSCGEISNWVDGRTWRLEVDDHIGQLRKWRQGKPVNQEILGSGEYRAKYEFMTGLVDLLKQMGAREFARQYEWTTCKSQPNVLKLKSANDNPKEGLIAVDFRAGLTLLPFLPMSPGDIKLIFQGLSAGSLVQFDRLDLNKLKEYIEENKQTFEGMESLFDELKKCETIYRNSIIDITHNGLKFLYNGKFIKQLLDSAAISYKTKNIVDEEGYNRLSKNKLMVIFFMFLSLIPILGNAIGKFVAHNSWRRHYLNLFNPSYFIKAAKGKIYERLIKWSRAGRMTFEKAEHIANCLPLALIHLPLSILPVGIHRILTDINFAIAKMHYLFIRPINLYFSKELREQWLKEMVQQGTKKHILSDEDARTILSQLNEPYIQKYLISLVVHLLTLPVTQIVSGIIAAFYYFSHPEMSQEARAAAVVFILGIFQVIPLSPGSLCRGLYAVGLAIKERDFKNYNIAVFMSFFKYIGYLSFPIQMTYRYPALARFMAGHWATEAVHIVPVFGERGALFEHWIFCLFYNVPLTIRRRMTERAVKRLSLKPRYWHIPLIAVFGAAIFAVLNIYAYQLDGKFFTLGQLWWLAFMVPFLVGALITTFAGGAAMYKRVISGAFGGLVCAGVYWLFLEYSQTLYSIGSQTSKMAFAVFGFCVFSIIGVLLTEASMPED